MWTVIGGFASLIAALLGICWVAIRAADEVDRLEAEVDRHQRGEAP
ncbi:MAG: hypothetical protein AB7O32_04890 [Vicinamibacterales bacterium]